MIKFLQVLLIINFVVGDERGARVRRIVGGELAPAPPEDDPVVFTTFAGKTARVEGSRDFPHYVFRGVRYAHAPTGKDRFLRPRQYFLEGYENATAYPPPCLQPVPGRNMVVGSEDCLFLNIFSPTLPTGMEGLPVVVWIHGGGFRYGSASQYGVRHLVGKQVMVVTIQYRLGSLGFLSSGSKELPGNAGLWDMVLAVQFVRNYIGFFGGNPHKIVVMGHGTGASSAMLVALSNVAKGLSSGIVAMSGSSVSHWSTDSGPADTAREIAEQNGCPVGSTITMVKCLQNIPPESVIMGDSNIEFQKLQNNGFVSGLSGRLGAAPVNEGLNDHRFLPNVVEREPMEGLTSEEGPKIPLLTGVTRDETKRACNGPYKKDIVNKLKTIPNFLDQVLVKDLQKSISFGKKLLGVGKNATNQLWNALDPLQFRNYLTVKKNDLKDGLSKISEATGDALFNVPAFLTVDLWSKRGAPSFLYRFEHNGKKKKGFSFLQGFPLVGNGTEIDPETSNDTIGHGDELAYLFDPQDLHGRSLIDPDEVPNEEDDKVRDIFTQMIANFVRSGKVNVGDENVRPFSASDNNFVQISPRPTVGKNFRFCEVALWCGLAQRLQSSTCSLIKVLDSQIKNFESLFDTSKLPSLPIGPDGNNNKLPGLGHLGGGILPGKNIFGTGNNNNQGKVGDALKGVVNKPLDIFGVNRPKTDNQNKKPFGIF